MRKHAQLLAGLIFAFGIVWVPLTANAQQSEKTPRIGLLGSYSPNSPLYNEFRQGLRELGYVEGKTSLSRRGMRKAIWIDSPNSHASLPVSM
jgi:hypothetical protein